MAVIGVFKTRDEAEGAIDLLRKNGFNPHDIGIVMRDPRQAQEMAQETGTRAEEAAAAGATFGGVLGGIAGFLLGIGAFVIPGLGPIIAGGALAATLGGATIGAASGGLLGALLGLGVPEHEAKYYESRVHGGDILVTVHGPDNKLEQARQLLDQAGATSFQDASEAGISGSDITPTSGIIGANMASTTPPQPASSAQTGRREAGATAYSTNENTPRSTETVPSGNKPSNFIRQQNDYPTDANDADVSLPQRPGMERGMDDNIPQNQMNREAQPGNTDNTVGVRNPQMQKADSLSREMQAQQQRASGQMNPNQDRGNAQREVGQVTPGPATTETNEQATADMVAQDVQASSRDFDRLTGGALGHIGAERPGPGEPKPRQAQPLDTDEQLAEQTGHFDRNDPAIRTPYRETNPNPETESAIRSAVAEDRPDIGQSLKGHLEIGQGNVKKGIGTITANEDIKRGGEREVEKGERDQQEG